MLYRLIRNWLLCSSFCTSGLYATYLNVWAWKLHEVAVQNWNIYVLCCLDVWVLLWWCKLVWCYAVRNLIIITLSNYICHKCVPQFWYVWFLMLIYKPETVLSSLFVNWLVRTRQQIFKNDRKWYMYVNWELRWGCARLLKALQWQFYFNINLMNLMMI